MKSLNLKSSLVVLGASAMTVSAAVSTWVQDTIVARIHGSEVYRSFLEKHYNFDVNSPIPNYTGKLAEVQQTYDLVSTITLLLFLIALGVAGFAIYKIARLFGKGRQQQNKLIIGGAAVFALAMLPIDALSYVLNPFSDLISIGLYVSTVLSIAVFQFLIALAVAFGFMNSYRRKKTDAFEEKLETKRKPSTQKTRLRLVAISIVVPLVINTALMIAAYPTASHRAIANQITETNNTLFENMSDENVKQYEKRLEQLTTTPEGKYSDRVNIFGSILMFPVSVGVIAWIYWQLRKKADPHPMKTFLTIGAITALVSLWISELVHRLYGIDSMIPLWLLGILSVVGPLFSLLPTWVIGLITKYFYEKRNGFEAS